MNRDERERRIAANSAALLAGMVEVWKLVDPRDFHPEYWVEQARAVLAGKEPRRKMRAPPSLLRRVRAGMQKR